MSVSQKILCWDAEMLRWMPLLLPIQEALKGDILKGDM